MTGELSNSENNTAKQLATQIETPDVKGLYGKPKVRYIQTVLNQRGFSSEVEDGRYDSSTRKVVEKYLQQKKLPRDTSIDLLIGHLRGNG